MKAKRYLSILAVMTIATSAVAFASSMQLGYPSISQFLFPFENAPQISETTERNKPIRPEVPTGTRDGQVEKVPDKVVYFILFNHLVGLKKQAEKAAAKGENLNYFRMYEEQANLTSSQSEILFAEAQKCLDAIKPIDDEARLIISKARGTGEVKSADDMPAPPKELDELQRRKDETILQFRDTLRSLLGAEVFAEFNRFAHERIAPQVKPMDQEAK